VSISNPSRYNSYLDVFSSYPIFLRELQLASRRGYDRFLTNPFQFVVSEHPATDAVSPDSLAASYSRLQNHSHLLVSLKNAVRNCEKQYFELGTPKTRRIFHMLLDTQLAEVCHTKGQWHTAIYSSLSVTRTVCEERWSGLPGYPDHRGEIRGRGNISYIYTRWLGKTR